MRWLTDGDAEADLWPAREVVDEFAGTVRGSLGSCGRRFQSCAPLG
jgi:hypothetical protein